MGGATKQKGTRKSGLISFYEQLRACACNLFKDKGCSSADSMLPGTGRSAEDLAGKTLLNLIEGGYWNPADDDEVPFALAYRMMKRDFLDIIKKKEYELTEITDSIDGENDRRDIENLPAPNTGFEAVEAKLLASSVKRLLGKDEQAKVYIDLCLAQGLESPSDVARAMGVSEQAAINIQRRLRYKTKLWETIFPDTQPGNKEKV
jgi:hypothetical protein